MLALSRFDSSSGLEGLSKSTMYSLSILSVNSYLVHRGLNGIGIHKNHPQALRGLVKCSFKFEVRL